MHGNGLINVFNSLHIDVYVIKNTFLMLKQLQVHYMYTNTYLCHYIQQKCTCGSHFHHYSQSLFQKYTGQEQVRHLQYYSWQ